MRVLATVPAHNIWYPIEGYFFQIIMYLENNMHSNFLFKLFLNNFTLNRSRPELEERKKKVTFTSYFCTRCCRLGVDVCDNVSISHTK